MVGMMCPCDNRSHNVFVLASWQLLTDTQCVSFVRFRRMWTGATEEVPQHGRNVITIWLDWVWCTLAGIQSPYCSCCMPGFVISFYMWSSWAVSECSLWSFLPSSVIYLHLLLVIMLPSLEGSIKCCIPSVRLSVAPFRFSRNRRAIVTYNLVETTLDKSNYWRKFNV